jgi:hypothetical protein
MQFCEEHYDGDPAPIGDYIAIGIGHELLFEVNFASGEDVRQSGVVPIDGSDLVGLFQRAGHLETQFEALEPSVAALGQILSEGEVEVISQRWCGNAPPGCVPTFQAHVFLIRKTEKLSLAFLAEVVAKANDLGQEFLQKRPKDWLHGQD